MQRLPGGQSGSSFLHTPDTPTRFALPNRSTRSPALCRLHMFRTPSWPLGPQAGLVIDDPRIDSFVNAGLDATRRPFIKAFLLNLSDFKLPTYANDKPSFLFWNDDHQVQDIFSIYAHTCELLWFVLSN